MTAAHAGFCGWIIARGVFFGAAPSEVRAGHAEGFGPSRMRKREGRTDGYTKTVQKISPRYVAMHPQLVVSFILGQLASLGIVDAMRLQTRDELIVAGASEEVRLHRDFRISTRYQRDFEV